MSIFFLALQNQRHELILGNFIPASSSGIAGACHQFLDLAFRHGLHVVSVSLVKTLPGLSKALHELLDSRGVWSLLHLHQISNYVTKTLRRGNVIRNHVLALGYFFVKISIDLHCPECAERHHPESQQTERRHANQQGELRFKTQVS